MRFLGCTDKKERKKEKNLGQVSEVISQAVHDSYLSTGLPEEAIEAGRKFKVSPRIPSISEAGSELV